MIIFYFILFNNQMNINIRSGGNILFTSLTWQTGQQMPGFGGKGFEHATEHTVSLHERRPSKSQVQDVHTSGFHVEPSGYVSL